jgi:steroid 5-alpha reductase family enzyme
MAEEGMAHFFLVSLVLTSGIQLLGFLVSALFKTEKLFDLAGGLNFVAIALVAMVLDGSYNERTLLVATVVCVSRIYLGCYLAFRVVKRKGDARFDSIRSSVKYLFFVYLYQILWVFTVSIPVVFIIGSGNGTENILEVPFLTDYLGFSIACIGFAIEVVSDVQKFMFRSVPSNNKLVCNVGLWRFSRHPNYFGEIVLWLAVFILGISVYEMNSTGWISVSSPIFTALLLLFGSGIPVAESKALKRYHSTQEASAKFEKYFSNTPPLVPCCCYQDLPLVAKQLCCCEYPMYRYNPDNFD